jgi:hypothetical protein
MTALSPQATLQAVMDGTLTVVDEISWLPPSIAADLRMGNAGCETSARRLAEALASDWTWRIGYDGLARMEWRKDPEVLVQVMSLNAAHALVLAVLQVLVLGPDGVKAAGNGALHADDAVPREDGHKMGLDA